MTNAEIIQAIRKEIINRIDKRHLSEQAKNELVSILSFLDTLQESEVDLDFQQFAQEIQSIFTLPASETQNSEENPLKWEYAIARHFYELGKGDRDTIFHEGMMYYRKQMTQEAVEGRIYKDEYAEQAPFYYVSSELFNLSPNMMNGDKVRIVVLKTEE